MRKRINNDFDALAEVLHEGVKIDLSLYEITSVRLVSNQAYPVTDYKVRNGSLFLHVTPLIVPKMGRYKIVVTYQIADPSLADGFWNFEFDKYLVTIVGSSEEEDAGDVVITADAVIGMQGKSAYEVWLEAGNVGTLEDYLADIKGDPFLYDDFTPEQLEALKVKGDKGDPFLYEYFTPEQIVELQRPATDAALLANEKATLANDAAILANEKAGLADTAATNADNARLAIQDDLALKEATANKQNSLETDGTGTKFPTVDAVNAGLAGLAGGGETLVATYVHSDNLEITVTAVDLATGVFTAVGHGLVEDDVLIFCMNSSLSPDILGRYIPNGLTHGVSLYAVYVDSDHFAVSTTAAGAQLTFTSNATMDLTKWHFEKSSTVFVISNLPEMTKCRVELSGVCINLRYLRPNLSISDNWVGNRDRYGSVNINGYSVWLDGELIFDTTDRVTIKGLMKGLTVNTSISNTYKEDEILLVNYQENVRGITFNSIFNKSNTSRLANGFTIKIYKL